MSLATAPACAHESTHIKVSWSSHVSKEGFNGALLGFHSDYNLVILYFALKCSLFGNTLGKLKKEE